MATECSNKIVARDLSVHYGSVKAIDSVSVGIDANSITSLIGPSGCGKSTFLRCLNRMNDLIPSAKVSGGVFIDGQDVYAPGTDLETLRTKVGMVFQRPNAFPMSVFDNVAYGPRVHRTAKGSNLADLVERSLVQAALWDEVKDRLRSQALDLSGGQQQRLCIARLLAVEPDVLLMDEPCSALDPISTSNIEELMLNLKSEYTIVIVTHNMQQAARVSQMTGFFYGGRLVEYDATAKIFENPSDKRTEDYITGRFG